MEITIEAKRFKILREDLGLTQSKMAEILDLKGSTADIERGRTRITGAAIAILLEKFHVNPLWLYGQTNKRELKLNKESILPSVITTDSEQNENILMVNQKAAAGYGKNIGDPDFYQKLPAFGMPLPEFRNASFRGFQIAGDSMYPFVSSGDWVLAKALSNLSELRHDGYYIFVEQDSIRFKQIHMQDDGGLMLVSINPEFPPIPIEAKDIMEVWEYHSRISFGHDRIKGLTLASLHQEIHSLKTEIRALRKA